MIKTPLSTVIGGAFWTPGATILGSSSQNLTQLIKSLFSFGEQGFAYDPNDLTTLYQDAAGTIPVTAAGQPVGLMLDKSKGLSLGSECFNYALNGILDGDGSLGAYTAATRTLSNSAASTSNARPIFNFTFNNWGAGKRYIVKGSILSGRNKIFAIRFGTSVGFTLIPVGADGSFYAVSEAPNNLLSIIYKLGEVGDIVLGDISVKELAGNHAYQTQSAMRPLLVANPQRLDYDTADDKLTTTLPAQLTGCTVIRSVPNAGTQILTGQTIPAPYNDNIDNCGLIVINRALTASETSQITKLFNKAAGV